MVRGLFLRNVGPEVLLEELPYPCPWLCGVDVGMECASSPKLFCSLSGPRFLHQAWPPPRWLYHFVYSVHSASAELELDNDNIFRCMVRLGRRNHGGRIQL
jgi:hypothetical protein